MRLSTTTVGDGAKTAALVHGLSAHGGYWSEVAAWLASLGYTVTVVDQRGHGASDRADSYLTEELADDLVETLPAGLDIIVGHSLGGRALLLAADRLRPERAIYVDPGWNVPAGLSINLPVDESGDILSLKSLSELLPNYNPEQLNRLRRGFVLADPLWFQAPNPILPDLEPPLSPVVPSLVVLADPPLAVRPELEKRLRDGGYNVLTVPGGVHDMPIEQFELTKQALAGWV
ncbi:Alpha/beta hydrolase family protein [Plantibacter sp. VKM Ac-1784]|uniref:Alpha/beta hydrolase family protein n=1 Tax=Plantibacter elymi (nom. nud.) TaxID=199708 RepID=A0ABY1RG09_9MICO|nr:alpha/beta hydrolase [Plantibacter sp. VKM Ac-1784]SMQ71157.1 Alpha/beta hydrolase family protein [Plantibacter sp. VKM Ac-1784]